AEAPGLRQYALGVRRARLRVRLRIGRPDDSGLVGSPVRRLRERRSGHHRPVPGLLGVEMATRLWTRAAAAARLRGSGAGALQRTPGALPPAVRRRQHPGVQPDDAGTVLSCLAAADEARLPQAADTHDSEEPATAQGGGLA